MRGVFFLAGMVWRGVNRTGSDGNPLTPEMDNLPRPRKLPGPGANRITGDTFLAPFANRTRCLSSDNLGPRLPVLQRPEIRVGHSDPYLTRPAKKPPVAFTDSRTRDDDAAYMAGQIDNIEGKLVASLGWIALEGTRHFSAVGAALSSVISLSFALLSLSAVPLVPGLGLILFLGILVSGFVIGLAAQTLSRSLWRLRGGDISAEMQALKQLKEQLRQRCDGKFEQLLPSEIKQLRRIERIENRVLGGPFAIFTDALIGVFGWDPRLGDLISRAEKEKATGETSKKSGRWFSFIPKPALFTRALPQK